MIHSNIGEKRGFCCETACSPREMSPHNSWWADPGKYGALLLFLPGCEGGKSALMHTHCVFPHFFASEKGNKLLRKVYCREERGLSP